MGSAYPIPPLVRARERFVVVDTLYRLHQGLADLYQPGVPLGVASRSTLIGTLVFRGHTDGRPFSVSDIHNHLELSRSAILGRIRRLEQDGVVIRMPDERYIMNPMRANSAIILAKIDGLVAILCSANQRLIEARIDDAIGYHAADALVAVSAKHCLSGQELIA